MSIWVIIGVSAIATIKGLQTYKAGHELLDAITGDSRESERILKTVPINWLWPNDADRFKEAALKALRQQKSRPR